MADSIQYKASNLGLSVENFSSTTQLTSTQKKISEIEKYDPFAERNPDHPNTDAGALAHFLKSSLGSGILAMPNAFKNAGLVLGMVLTFVAGFICTHCVYILVRSSHALCRKGHVPVLTYAETAEYAFRLGNSKMQKWSNFAKNFVNCALVTAYFSVCCVYLVFIATSFKQVLDFYYGNETLDIRLYILVAMVPALVLSLIPNLKYLVPFSTMANVFIVICFGVTLYYMFREPLDFSDKPYSVSVVQLPLFFSTVIFAMEGIGVVMPVENSMKNPSHFLGCPGVLNIAMSMVVTLYSIIGFFGYVKYGNETEGSITLNLPENEILAQVIKILIGLAILFSYPLQFYVGAKISLDLMEPKIPAEHFNKVNFAFRTVAVILTGCLAIAVPNLGPIISLVGAVFFSLLGLFCPAVIEIATFMDGWEGGLGRFRWLLYKDIAVIVFSIIGLLFGTYASVLEIIATY